MYDRRARRVGHTFIVCVVNQTPLERRSDASHLSLARSATAPTTASADVAAEKMFARRTKQRDHSHFQSRLRRSRDDETPLPALKLAHTRTHTERRGRYRISRRRASILHANPIRSDKAEEVCVCVPVSVISLWWAKVERVAKINWLRGACLCTK